MPKPFTIGGRPLTAKASKTTRQATADRAGKGAKKIGAKIGKAITRKIEGRVSKTKERKLQRQVDQELKREEATRKRLLKTDAQKAASLLGSLARGVPKAYSPQEIARRTSLLAGARAKRWAGHAKR